MSSTATSSSENIAGTSEERSSMGNTMPTYCTVGTQTDFTLENSTINMNTKSTRAVQSSLWETNVSPIHLHSTPKQPKRRELRPPEKLFEEEELEEELEEIGSITPPPALEDIDDPTEDTLVSIADREDSKDQDYAPRNVTGSDSELFGASSILFGEEQPSPPELTPLTAEEQVKDKKMIIFESCLDNLLYKLKRQYSKNFNYLVKKILKKFPDRGVV